MEINSFTIERASKSKFVGRMSPLQSKDDSIIATPYKMLGSPRASENPIASSEVDISQQLSNSARPNKFNEKADYVS